MTLLAQYLKTVRMYLPARQRDDILRELEENLRSQLEEQEAALGRPLTEPEQRELLLAHGNPMIVAGRYGAEQRTVTFGRQLIGPELFPLYIRVLLGNWVLSIVVHAGLAISNVAASEPRPFFMAVVAQFVVITVTFSIIDFLQRRSKTVEVAGARDMSWRFPPAYLREVPRWQSRSGFIAWSLLSAWWAALPYAPSLLLGTATSYVQFSPAWSTFYWPVLFLLLAGVAQRAANSARPDWNWLLPVTRLGINLVGLALVYPMVRSAPYFVALPSAGAAGDLVARGLELATYWTVAWGFSVAFLIQVGLNGWQCLQHARFLRRQR